MIQGMQQFFNFGCQTLLQPLQPIVGLHSVLWEDKAIDKTSLNNLQVMTTKP
jgi:hypothetical protein